MKKLALILGLLAGVAFSDDSICEKYANESIKTLRVMGEFFYIGKCFEYADAVSQDLVRLLQDNKNDFDLNSFSYSMLTLGITLKECSLFGDEIKNIDDFMKEYEKQSDILADTIKQKLEIQQEIDELYKEFLK